MDVRDVTRFAALAGACVMTAAIGVGATLAAAQFKPPSSDEPLAKPKLMIMTVLQLADLSEAQRTQIATILQTHRVDVQAAREAGDPVEVRSAMREAMREIVATLTPDQREAAKAAVRKAIAPQN
jgi:Spy/CpxP family protein refolding chaperone